MSEDESYLAWKGWQADGFGAVRAYDRRYFSMELRRAGVPSLAGLRVLEIGFGSGVFAAWATAAGARYSGVDINRALVRRGMDAGFDVTQTLQAAADRLGTGVVDVVVGFDVFEHLDAEALERMLVQLRQCLKPGGLLIGRVPSGDSPFSGHYQHGDLTHRQVLGSGAVRQLAVRTGFVVECIRSQAFPVRGLGPRESLRKAIAYAARSVVYPLVAGLLMGARKAVVSPNLVFVLRNP
jgi:SAM-dependent methyltransferase